MSKKLSISDRFYKKAISSFNKDRVYQGLREFNSALIRSIEEDNYKNIKDYLINISPILQERNLDHEAKQIVESLVKHLKKHSKLIKGIPIIFDALIELFKLNSTFDISQAFYQKIIEYLPLSNSENLTEEMIAKSETVISLVEASDDRLTLIKIHFYGLILIFNWEKATILGQSYFLNTEYSNEMIDYIAYTLLIQAILGDVDLALSQIKVIRKNNSIEENLILEMGAELLLAINSHDLDWWEETKNHFKAEINENHILKIIIGELFRKSFPEAQSSFLDFLM